MKQYPAYKDSGVEWIGDIPNEWMLKKISHGFRGIGSGTTPSSNNEKYYVDGSHNWLQTGDLTDNVIVNTSKKITDDALSEYPTLRIYPRNSLVIAMYGATIGKVGILKIESATNQACCVLSKGNEFTTEFVYYWFLANKPHVISLGYGGGQPNISQEIIRSLRIPCPSYEEQAQITTFLDFKTHQIDDLISKKQKHIELLKEERTALINQAVTKGLDPNVPMKDSGIEWLGEIPDHWMVKRLKFLVENIIEKANISEFKVALENIESWTGQYLKTENPAELTGEMKSFKPNDVLFNKLRPYLAKVYLPEVEGECVGELLVLRSITMIIPKFLYYRLLSRDFIEVVNGSTYGAKMPRASWEDFIRNLIIPYPEMREQNQIVESIDKMTIAIANTIVKLEHEIELIAEYKTSLINEAVTGKIDVRNYNHIL